MDPAIRPERLLLVDDSETSLLLLTTILRGGGYQELTTVRSGEEALQTLDELYARVGGPPCDIILMDINMPGMNGIDTTKAIKADGRFYDIPVVMVTISDEQQNLSLAFEAGAIDYVNKPVSRIELLARVRSVLRFNAEMQQRLENERGLLELTASLADAYSKLEDLNANLELHVQQRTAQLESALAELKELDVMKTAFLSNISHELLTPLTAVLGFASRLKHMLAETLLPPLKSVDLNADLALQKAVVRAEGHIEIIISESQRLTQRIRDVLDLSEMEAGDSAWRSAPMDVGAVAREAVETLAPRAVAKGLALRADLEPNLPLVHGDGARLGKAIRELLSNAIKFTQRGDVVCRVALKPRTLLVCVSDTGDGFDARDKTRIFETFRQLGDGLTDKPHGAGLGLPLCAHIVAHHGGRIWANSEPGKGSTFYFVRPAGRTHLEVEVLYGPDRGNR